MNKNLNRLLLILLCALTLSACGQAGRYSGTLITEGNHRVVQAERLQGGILLLDGHLTIEPGGVVDGSIIMLNGRVELAGELTGDLSVLDGQLQLGAHSRVGGNLLVAGGELERQPGAQVSGTLPQDDLDTSDFFGATQRSSPTLLSILIRAFFQALLAAAVVRWLPKPAVVVSQAITEHSLVSAAVGVFTSLIGLILIVQMAFTVVLVPMSILLAVLSLLTVGLTSIFYGYIIGRMLQQWQRGLSMPLAAGFGAAAYTLLAELLGIIPYAGALVQLLLIAIAVGGLILTRLGLRPYQPPHETRLI